MRTGLSKVAGLVGLWGICGVAAALPWEVLTDGNTPWQSLQRIRQVHDLPGASDLLAQAAAIVGDEALSCANRRQIPRFDGTGRWQDALSVLAGDAGQYRVIMLNESHDRSRHRAFLEQMIVMLHEQGVRALAAETLSPQVAGSVSDGQVRTTSGVYTRDPVFANAVRMALALGWTLVPYEPELSAVEADPRAAREQGQAEALADWLQAHPEERLLVYVGGSHLDKRPEAGWMAARLSRLTGEAPLSIRQGATACPGDDVDHWPRLPGRDGVALVDRDREATLEADRVIIHPPVSSHSGRPGWLARLPGRMAARICLPDTMMDGLLRVFPPAIASDPTLVAIDQLPIEAGQREAVVLVAAAGRWEVVLERADGNWQRLGGITVPVGKAACLLPE